MFQPTSVFHLDMHRALLLLGLLACDRDVVVAPDEPPAVAPKPVVTPAPTPVPAPPAKPKLGRIVRIELRDNYILCAHDAANATRCVHMKHTNQLVLAEHDTKHAKVLELAGTSCTYDSVALVCPGQPPRPMTFSHGHFWYLHDANGVYWFDAGAMKLSAARTFGGGVKQLSVGYRVGCVLAGNGEVWCWSNPATPKRVTTPPKVAEIMVQDPFELCVRTEGGELHCGPPFVQQEPLFCHKDKLACGTGGIEQRELTTSFDPLAKLARPLRRVALASKIERLVRDEDQIYLFCMDSLAVLADRLGGCTIDGKGEVACFAPCGSAWRSTRVTGLPATTKLWSDDSTGYALTATGALWAWPHGHDFDQCGAATTAARSVGIQIADLAPPLFARSGPQRWDLYRCALLTDGTVRCWTPGEDGHPSAMFDPFK
jgi:hypothetical protein